MEVISLLDSSSSEDEEKGGRAAGAAAIKPKSRGKGRERKTQAKPQQGNRRRLIRAEDSEDDEDAPVDHDHDEEGFSLPTARNAHEPASQDDARGPANGARTTHHDDVVEDSDSDADKKGSRRGPRKAGHKRSAAPLAPSTMGTKKARKAGGDKDGGPSSSILQFMKKTAGGGSSSISGGGTSSASGVKRKRPASQLLQPPPPPKTSQQMWVDKHHPKKASELSIPPQKVKQVRQWLTTALEQHSMNKLLILRGPPGVGKSTMVEVLADEMKLDVLGWTEAAGGQAWRGGGEEEVGGMLPPSPRGEFFVPYVSQADDFGNFLRGAAYKPLVVSTSSSKKSLYQLSQEAATSKVRSRVFLIQELPSQVDNASSSSGSSSTYSQRALSTFQSSLESFLRQSVHPAVLIYTECESSGGDALLEKMLSRAIVQDPRVQQIQIRPTTDLNLRKVLERVAGEEGLRFTTSHEVEEIVTSCNGDIRHALMKLQFQYGHRRKLLWSQGGSSQASVRSSSSSLSQGGGSSGGNTPRGERSKDRFYSSMHAIGKVLHAKRDSSLPGLGDGHGRGPLSFDPEHALSRCDMEIDGLAVFLQYHCVPLFTDVEELAGALDHFSDADLFISRLYSTSHMRDLSDVVFPEEYALSISSRAVADTNIHPAPPAFRSYPTPRYWETNRRRIDGVRRLSYLSNLYTQSTADQDVHPGRIPATTMVTEFVPFVKAIGERRQGGRGSSGGGEDPSLIGAQEFLRMFNQTCCMGVGSGAYRSIRDQQQHILASSTAQDVMDVDDIVDD